MVDSFHWTPDHEPGENEEDPEGSRWSLRLRVYDGDGDGGDLRVWVNKDSLLSPDPSEEPDGVLFLPGSAAPFEETIQPDAEFTVGEETDTLLSGILSGSRRQKVIFVEFVTTAGKSTGVIEVRVPSWFEGVDWSGRVNPDVPTTDGWFIGTLRDAHKAALDAIGMTESGWNSLLGKNPDGTRNEKAFEDEFFKDATVVDRLFAANVFTESVVTKVLAAGSIIASKIYAESLSAITASLGLVTAGRMRSAEGPGTEDGLFDIHLDERVLTIKDKTGQTRLQLGKLAGTDTAWGLTLLGPSGEVWFTSDPALVPASTGPLGDGIIFTRHFVADQIESSHLKAGSVTADKINVVNLAAIKADLGEVTAGRIEGTNGILRLNSSYPSPQAGSKPFIDFAATGSEDFIRHPLFKLGVTEAAIGKTIEYPALSFRPHSNNNGDWSYSTVPEELISGEVTSTMRYFSCPIVLPVGVTITGASADVYRFSTEPAIDVDLILLSGFSYSTLWSASATTTTGSQTLSTTGLSTTLAAGDRLIARVGMYKGSALLTPTAALRRFTVSYDMTDFRQGI